ncbi:MAG: hypothetical protein DME08_02270 [Candidatus Rokuibacteriota bacterium]|nr:MAG: hypothetical protein DME08_02270 [Candidatus Rokubacteria bacterium]
MVTRRISPPTADVKKFRLEWRPLRSGRSSRSARSVRSTRSTRSLRSLRSTRSGRSPRSPRPGGRRDRPAPDLGRCARCPGRDCRHAPRCARGRPRTSQSSASR